MTSEGKQLKEIRLAIVSSEALKMLINEHLLFSLLSTEIIHYLNENGFLTYGISNSIVPKYHITQKGIDHVADYGSNNYKLKDLF